MKVQKKILNNTEMKSGRLFTAATQHLPPAVMIIKILVKSRSIHQEQPNPNKEMKIAELQVSRYLCRYCKGHMTSFPELSLVEERLRYTIRVKTENALAFSIACCYSKPYLI